jgi:hypothetical protein
MADGLLSIQRRKNDRDIATELEERKLQKQALKSRYKLAVPLYSYAASKVCNLDVSRECALLSLAY